MNASNSRLKVANSQVKSFSMLRELLAFQFVLPHLLLYTTIKCGSLAVKMMTTINCLICGAVTWDPRLGAKLRLRKVINALVLALVTQLCFGMIKCTFSAAFSSLLKNLVISTVSISKHKSSHAQTTLKPLKRTSSMNSNSSPPPWPASTSRRMLPPCAAAPPSAASLPSVPPPSASRVPSAR